MTAITLSKADAIKLFGHRAHDLAQALRISDSAISKWPEVLDHRRTHEVLGAALVRYGENRLTEYGVRVIDQLLIIRTDMADAA